MDRSEALSYIKPFADRIYMLGKRQLDDTSLGYGPAIDEALRSLGFEDPDLPTANVEDGNIAGYRAALKYYSLDLIEWNLLTLVDGQVDAPLTNIKWSMALKSVATKKAQALSEMSREGIGPNTVTWVRWQFDYLEVEEEAEVSDGSL